MDFFTDMLKHVLKVTLYLLSLLLFFFFFFFIIIIIIIVIIVFSFFDLVNAQYNFLDAL